VPGVCKWDRRSPDQDVLLSRLKCIVDEVFAPDLLGPMEIVDEEPLIGGRLGLDCVDALEPSICVEEEFGVALCRDGEPHKALASVGRLADFIVAGGRPSVMEPPVLRYRFR
jgi:acyl carrier protein